MNPLPATVVYGARASLAEWRTSMWLILGASLGLGLFIAVSGLGKGYARLVRMPLERMGVDLVVQRGGTASPMRYDAGGPVRLPFSNQLLTPAQQKAIASLPGIQSMNPALILWYQKEKQFAILAGIDPADSSGGPARAMDWITQGRAIRNRDEIVAESHYARFHRLRPGDSVRLHSREFTLVGIATIREGASLAAANFFLSLEDAASLLNRNQKTVNLLSLRLRPGTDADSLRKRIQDIVPDVLITSADNMDQMLRGFAGISQTAARTLSWSALIFSCLLHWWLVAGQLQEQAWQNGLMRTLGWKRSEAMAAALGRTCMLTLISALAGTLLGLATLKLLSLVEVSLTLPWNLAPGQPHRMAAARTLHVALPLSCSPATVLPGLVLFGCGAALTALVSVTRQLRRSVRELLIERF